MRTLAPAVPDALRCEVALTELIGRVGLEAAEPVAMTRWPAHLDLIDPRRLSQPEVEAVVVRRLVAPAADPLPGLPASGDCDTHQRAHGIAVGPGPFQGKADGVPNPPAPVVEIGQGLALGEDDQVEPAVVVEVAGGQSAPDPGDRPGWSRTGGHVEKTATR